MSDPSTKEILKRLERLEKAVFGARNGRPAEKQKQATNNALPTHILALRDKGFFSTPRTAKETGERLRPVYHCQLDRVSMALLRLQKTKQFRKTTKLVGNKKQLAYVW